jgi:hypothetical protein
MEEENKDKKNEIPPQIESMDNMRKLTPIAEENFVPVEKHVGTPFIATETRDDSIEPLKKSTTEIPPVPLVPVLGEMKNDMYSMENNTRKKIKIQTNKKTKRRRRCRKGSRRNKRTHRCRKNKKRV